MIYMYFLLLIISLQASIIFEFPKEFSTMSLKKEFLQKFKDIGCVNFFETGTCVGTTLRNASEVFDVNYSVELHKYFYDLSCQNLSGLKNIKIFNETSINALKNHVNELKGLTLFWLDAHNSPSIKPSDENCPLLEEINWIFDNIDNDNFILLIDDVRCSTWPTVNWVDLKLTNNNIDSLYNEIGLGWPTFKKIKETVLLRNNLDLALIGDILVIFSKKYDKFFDQFIKDLVNVFETENYEFSEEIKNSIFYRNQAQLWIDSLNIWENKIYHNHLIKIKSIFN